MQRGGSQYTEQAVAFMLSEELKKPLTTIGMLADSNSPEAIKAEARRALRTIDSIQTLHRVQADQLQLIPEPVHIGSVLRRVHEQVQPLANTFGCETEIVVRSGLPTVDADTTVLQQSIQSLWQAVIVLTKRPSPLEWTISRASNGVRLVVVNNALDLSKVHLSSSTNITSKQPIAGVAGAATDLMCSRGLFTVLGGKLTKTTRDSREGFCVTLPVSPQLSLL